MLYQASKLASLTTLNMMEVNSGGATTTKYLEMTSKIQSLKELDIYKCDFTLSPGFGLFLPRMQNLTSLDISQELFTSPCIDAIATMQQLRRLCLEHGEFAEMAELGKLADLANMENLEDLSLRGFKNGVAGCMLGFSRTRSLQKLTLLNCEFLQADVANVAKMDRLVELDLSYSCSTGPPRADVLRPLAGMAQLTKLTINKGLFDGKMNREETIGFVASIAACSSLVELDLAE
jgi:hypothetical protein